MKGKLNSCYAGLLLLLISFNINAAFAQTWKWGRGNTGAGIDAWPIAADGFGNVYGAGIVFPPATSVSFGSVSVPYSITYTTNNPGWEGNQTVIVKYDSSGNVLWAKGIQVGESTPVSIATDPGGNLVLLGVFDVQQIKIDNTTLNYSLPTAGLSQYFIVKFDPNGNVLWAKTSGEASGFYNLGLSSGPLFSTGMRNLIITWGGIATDHSGNIFVAGDYNSPTNSIGTFTVTNSNSSGDSDDVFVAKYDASGNVVWATNFGGNGFDDAFGITVSSTGDVYISGGFTSPGISCGSSTLSNAYGSQMAFVAKFSPGGTPLWAEAGGGPNGAIGVGMTNDNGGNVYMAGGFGDNTITFGSTTLTRAYPSTMYNALFLVQISSSNTITWHKTISSPSSDINGYSVSLAACGQVWVSGSWGRNFSGINDSADVDGHTLYTPPVNTDPIFIAGYNLSGGVVGYGSLGGGGDDQNGIACDPHGNIYVCSDYLSASIVIGPDTLNKSPGSSEIFFLAKFQNAIDTSTVYYSSDTILCAGKAAVLQAPIGSASPFIWNQGDTTYSINVSNSGTFWVSCNGSCSAAKIVDTFHVTLLQPGNTQHTTDTTICHQTAFILQAPKGCSAYEWSNGDTLSSISTSSAGTYWVQCTAVCGSYTDTFQVSVSNLNLAFNLGNDTLACAPVVLTAPISNASYLWQDGSVNQNFTAKNSGTYTVTISENGCSASDSIHVTIIYLKPVFEDTTVCLDKSFDISLNSGAPQGASIVWSTGSISSNINVSDTGTYWVFVKDSSCYVSDTMHLTGGYCNCNCFVPNAFTPNHDGKNDGIKPIIKTECIVSNYLFSIFDRWGTLVFTSHDPSARWDGTYQGVPYQIGTYMYEVSYTGGLNNKKYFFKGDITLVR